MQIDPETWAKIRVAVQFDDTETFHQLVRAFADRVVYHEQARKKAADRARSFEQGYRPYLASERTHR